MSQITKARISATAFTSILLDNTKALRASLEKYVHFAPVSFGVVQELLNSTFPQDEHRAIYNKVYAKLTQMYPNSFPESIDITKIASVVTNDKAQRLSGRQATGVYKGAELVGVLTSNYANASKLVVKVIQDIIGVNLAVGHVVGDVQVVTSSTLGGHLWVKNNISMRSPLSMKLSIIQELFMIAEHVERGDFESIRSWYFKPEGTRYLPRRNFMLLKETLTITGKVFTGDLHKLSSDDTLISKTAIDNGFKDFYIKYFKPVNEKLKRAKDDLSAGLVTQYISTGLQQLADTHAAYFNKVVDSSTITKEFTAELSSLKIIFVLPQTSLFNSVELAQIEKRIANEALKFGVNSALDYIGSPSLRNYIVESIVEGVVTGKTKKFSNKNKAVDGKMAAFKLPAPIVSAAEAKVFKRGKTKVAIPRLRNVRGQFVSQTNLFALISALLPEVIESNMTSPNLNYQTGRFADSVELKALETARDGSVTAFLTYMKYPYETYEPGFARGYLNKSPTRLIDQSVREIAIGLVRNRLRTVIV